MVMMTGMGLPHAVEAAVLYLIAHALFKGGLFMVAGIIDHETGTRDLTKLGGLAKAMPITFSAGLAGAISMGGLPPFVGFLSKEAIYEALVTGTGITLIFLLVAILGNALMFAVGFGVGLKPFVGAKTETPKHAHEAPVLMWIGPIVLGGSALIGALFSHGFHEYFSNPMSSAVAGEPVDIHLSLIPHIGYPLGLSVLTVMIAVLFYWRLSSVRGFMAAVLARVGSGPDKWFDCFMQGIVRLSFAVSQKVQPGRLEFYITATFIAVGAVLMISLFSFGEMPPMPTLSDDIQIGHWTVFIIAVAGLLAVINAQNRLSAIVTLGLQGFAVAIIFLLLGAPDLSFTQFMVETLSVVILTLVMTRLNLVPSDHRELRQKLFDGAIAIVCGFGFSMLLMRVTAVPFNDALTNFFNTYSKTIAHGHNVVNVIIVDFRGTDTLGEIGVVMITGLAILALIRIRAGRRFAPSLGARDEDAQQEKAQ